MSRGTATPPSQQPGSPQSGPPSYEAFIDERLRRTRRQVKGVDIAGGLIVLLNGILVFLLAAAVADHWVVSGGLGFWSRLLLLAGLALGAGWYAASRVLVPLLGRINPIFAAHTIEQSRPSLKNSLVNFLLLRRDRRQLAEPIYQTLEYRAAADLSQIEIETAVDRTHVIRSGYVLVGMVAVCGLYLVLSPKNPLTSAARVLWPWSGIPAPTRVTIGDVRPGDTEVFHGDFITVSAEVLGVEESEAVTLCYSTADGQNIDQKVPMTRPEGGYRHQYQCQFPPEEQGLQQDVLYYLTAGDYSTRRFAIDVQTPPMILIDRVEYRYPAYTGFSDRIVEREGDVRAIEGTRITIRATANREIAWAGIDLGCTGARELDMQVGGMTATGGFTLRLNPTDPNLPEHDSYQLRFRDRAGRLSPRPTRQRIEVIRDLPPEVRLLSPQEENVELAADGRLEIGVWAEDPDFALRKVILRAESGGRDLVIPPMLDRPHEDEFHEVYVFKPAGAELDGEAFDPAAAGLKPGDRVRYWAEAEDSKEPVPNRSITAQKWITIVEPPSSQPVAEQPGGDRPGAAQRGADEGNGSPEPQPNGAQQPKDGGGQSPADERQAADQPPQGEGSEDQGQQPEPSSGQQPGQAGESAEQGDSGGQSDAGASGGAPQQPSDGGQNAGDGGPIDPDTQPGDAFEEILRHRQQQQQRQGEQPPGALQPGDQPTGDQGAGGGRPDGGRGGRPQEDTRQGSDQQGGESQDLQGQADQGEVDTGDDRGQRGDPQQPPEPTGPQREPPGAGERPGEDRGTPAPQGENRPRGNEPGQPDEVQQPEGPAQSPSTSRQQSDSQGDTSGDRSGGGQKGGGQRSPQPGRGTDGSQTEADEGGSAGREPGDGQTGTRGGSQTETDEQTGSSAPRRGGADSGRSGQRGDTGAPNRPSEEGGPPSTEPPQDGAGQPGNGLPAGQGSQGDGSPMPGGGQSGQSPQGTTPPEQSEPGGEDPNLEYAREAVDLALEYLKDQMDQGESDLLDQLGWTPEEAKRFVEKWEQMEGAAARGGTQGDASRRELDRALDGLGLRPGGTQLEGGDSGTDDLPGLREAGRFDAPGDWSELFRAYTRGIAGDRGQ